MADKKVRIVTERGISLGDPNVWFHTDYCVKTRAEVDAILKKVAYIISKDLIQQEMRRQEAEREAMQAAENEAG